MSGNKAWRRAAETKDAIRIGTDIPLITDETVQFTPDIAHEWLQTKNRWNRPLNLRKAKEYSQIMKAGNWRMISQGIILDEQGFIITGQTRLLAVVLSKVTVYMRVSRGNRRVDADFIDRGRPQTARDLATRKTEQTHTATEASIARAICALEGRLRPSADLIAATIVKQAAKVDALLDKTTGTKKTKAVLMVLAAICVQAQTIEEALKIVINTQKFADRLEATLQPQSAKSCWNKGAAFSLALNHARAIVAGSGMIQ